MRAVWAEADAFAQRLVGDAMEELWGPPAAPPGMVMGMICSGDHLRLPGGIVQRDRLLPDLLAGHASSMVTSWLSHVTTSTVVLSTAAPFEQGPHRERLSPHQPWPVFELMQVRVWDFLCSP